MMLRFDALTGYEPKTEPVCSQTVLTALTVGLRGATLP